MLIDLAGERAVLGGICQHGSNAFIDVDDIITVNTFTDITHQSLYKCLQYLLRDKPDVQVDMASICSVANQLGLSKTLLEKTEDRNVLRAIMNFSIYESNVRKMAAKIRKLEIARVLGVTLEDIKKSLEGVSGDESISHILGLAENPIFDLTSLLTNTQSGGPVLLGEGVREYAQHLIDNPVDIIGIPSGFPMYDMSIGGGLQPGVNLIGARPKIGKTTLADNMGINISRLGLPVLDLDTEMSKKDHWNRIISNLSGVNINRFKTGKYGSNQEERDRVFSAIDLFEKLPYSFESIIGQPFEETIATMRRWVVKKVGLNKAGTAKPCVIIYDYLKLMNPDHLNKNIAEYQMLGFQITALHNFMAKYEIPCIGFIQLNRDGITREDTDVASGSDRQIWLCTSFTIFKKKSDDEQAEDGPKNGNRKFVPIVARHGPDWDTNDYIIVTMQGQFARCVEGKTRNELHRIESKTGFESDAEEEVEFV